MSGERETFGSRFGSVMALMGVAVGLANVWRFPYMAGSYGGAAFVLLYIFFGIVLVDGVKLYWHWSRGKALAVLIPIQLLIALPSMASSDFLQWNDRIWGSTMQPIGSALALVALGWFVARGKALAEINRGSSMAIGPFWVFWIRWVIHAAIIVILVSGWWPQ